MLESLLSQPATVIAAGVSLSAGSSPRSFGTEQVAPSARRRMRFVGLDDLKPPAA